MSHTCHRTQEPSPCPGQEVHNTLNSLNISDNLIRLRHEKKVTQEELANFLGITKASVSKWETRQSMPDILLLPQLAAYFGITIDELIGYEPQLSKEQIRKLYTELSDDFSCLPFEEVMDKSRTLMRKYYSCYPFLMQICILWLNHYILAEDAGAQQKILREAKELCSHIIEDCKILPLCNDAVTLKAMLDMLLGNATGAVDSLTNVYNPIMISNQSDAILIQAYTMAGQTEEALNQSQISMYTHMLSLVGTSTYYMSLNAASLDICEATMKRMDSIIKVYNLEYLHPNTTAGYHYQAAIVYAINNLPDAALTQLDSYAGNVVSLMSNDNYKLHGDDYFTRLDVWFEQLDLGINPPRNPKTVADSLMSTLENPVFAPLKASDRFQSIRHRLEELIKQVKRDR